MITTFLQESVDQGWVGLGLLGGRAAKLAVKVFGRCGKSQVVSDEWRGPSGGDTEAMRAGLGNLGFKTKLDYLADGLHKRVQRFGLGVATTQCRNGGDVEAFLVLLD